MDGKRWIAALAAAAVLIAGMAFAERSAKARNTGESDGKALFEAKCPACHDLDRALGKNKDREGWTATVTRMRQVNGCPITDAEAGEIVDYLVKIRGPARYK